QALLPSGGVSDAGDLARLFVLPELERGAVGTGEQHGPAKRLDQRSFAAYPVEAGDGRQPSGDPVLVRLRKKAVPEALGQARHQLEPRIEPNKAVASEQRLGKPGGDLEILTLLGKRLDRELADRPPLRGGAGARLPGIHGPFGGAGFGARVAQPII